jgi:NAD(P)-dependent dehydrogenase (short-subunit alcohol dehydrogenase family)
MTGTIRDARVVITGATSGIGRAAALELARQGARVTIVCRDTDKGAATVAELRDAVPGLSADVVRCDLADLESVRRAGFELVDRYDTIDVLINNAGVNDTEASLTVDGFDHMMASNYLGPFLLTRLVLDRVKAAAPSRIVVVGSEAHRMAGPFDPERFEDLGRYGPVNNTPAYGRTKLLDQLFTNELARRLEGTGVTANSVCPGLVATNLVDMGPLRPIVQAAARTPFVNTPAEGARLVVRLATDPKLEGVTGRFYTTTPGMRLLPPVPAMLDTRLQRRVWERTEVLVGLTPAG